MLKALILFLVLAAALAKFEPFNGHLPLASGGLKDADGYHNLRYHHFSASGRTTHLEYHAKPHTDDVSIYDLGGFKAVTCSAHAATLTFISAEAASHSGLRVGNIIMGGPEFPGCGSKGQGLLRRVTSVTVSGSTVVLGTTGATLMEALPDATIMFHTSDMHRQGPSATRRLDWLSDLYNFFVTGDYNFGPWTQEIFTTGWNSPNNPINLWTSDDGDVTLTCDNCYATFDVSVTLQVSVVSNALSYLSVSLDGAADLNAQVTLAANYDWSTSGSTQLADVDLPTIAFSIGPVPVVLTPSIPITVGYSLSASASASATAAADASGSASIGFEYNQGTVTWPTSMSFNTAGSVTAHADATATAVGWIQPGIRVSMDGLLDVEADVKGSVTGTVTASSDAGCGGSYGQVSAEVDLGVAVTATASVGFPEVWFQNLGTWSIWSNSWQLWQGCAGLGRRLDAPRAVPALPAKTPSTCATGCTTITSLQYCRQLNGVPLCLTEQDALAAEQDVWSAVQALASRGLGCASTLLDYYCAMALPACGATGTVTPIPFTDCMATLTQCDVPTAVAQQECTGVAVDPFSNLQITGAVSTAAVTGQITSSCVVAPATLQYCVASEGLTVAINPHLFSGPLDADEFVGQLVDALVLSGVSDSCVNAVTIASCAEFMPQCDANGNAEPMCEAACEGVLSSCDVTQSQAQSICQTIVGSASTSCGYATAAVNLKSSSPASSGGMALTSILLLVGAGVVAVGGIAIGASVYRRRRRALDAVPIRRDTELAQSV